MALRNKAGFPAGDPVVRLHRAKYRNEPDPEEGFITQTWADWLQNLVDNGEKSASRVASASFTDQTSDIADTDITGGIFTAGLYRISSYLRVVTGEVGATAQLTWTWTARSIVRTQVGSKVDGGGTTNYESATTLIRIDALTPILYSLDIVSLGTLAVDLDLVVEEIHA